jgi:multiple sugar transport system substrate-binding protein
VTLRAHRLLAPAALLFAALLAASCQSAKPARTTIRFWGMGREGEVVQDLVPDFEREHPDIHVIVQQVPWSAAHEKLVTGFVGRSTPDVSQLGNTWVPEFTALKALEPLRPWLASSSALDSSRYFPGIWDTNVIDGQPYGLPWYVDTRVLFYRKDVLAKAGYTTMPTTWSEWRTALRAMKKVVGEKNYPIFLPLNEWNPPVIFAMQAGSPLLKENATRAAFTDSSYKRGFDFYLSLFHEGLAPPVGNNEVANVYQEFGRGYLNMWITGPWNLGEMRNRLPAERQNDWATAPLPGPDGAESGVSLAGGSSLVLYKDSPHKREAWAFIEYLSRPEVQLKFWKLTGDLPGRVEAWRDTALMADPNMHAFQQQLEHVVATPKTAEWEQIAIRLQDQVERVVRGSVSPDSAMSALSREVDLMLEKRRWMRERALATGGAK